MSVNCPHCEIELNEDKVHTIRKLPSQHHIKREPTVMHSCKECGKSIPAEVINSIS